MKRTLFLAVAITAVISLSAQTHFSTIAGPAKDISMKLIQPHPGQVNPYSDGQVIGQKNFDNTIIGTTWYDSQTYANIMQRVWAFPDGTIGATWQSSDPNASLDRGTGYNYFDGTEWQVPTMHLGSDARTGWPSYAPWGPNGEILCHYHFIPNEGPIKFFKRETKGEGEWIETVLDPPDGYAIVWHSMITSGENNEYIHLLAYTWSEGVQYEGQDNALLYYRSSDGAETWEIDAIIIDGLGADYFATINSLSYAWANPVGETIAFTYGFDIYGGRVFKSYDNGDTWEIIEAVESVLDPVDPPADSPDIPCGSGSSACVIDSQENVHVVFTRAKRYLQEGDEYVYLYVDGLIYWNETMPVLDTTIISSYTLEYLEDAGNLCGWVIPGDTTFTIVEGQPHYWNGLVAYPQMAIDAEDNIFVTSSFLSPAHDNFEFIYRHIQYNSTFDLGNSWGEPRDLTASVIYIFSECAFPAMAPFIYEDVLVLFQEDPYPGMFEWVDPPNHDAVENNMMFMSIDKELLGVGIGENLEASSIEMYLYPNPATEEIFLQLEIEETSTVKITMLDQVGRTVISDDLGRCSDGTVMHMLEVSTLAPGVYFVQAKVGNKSATRKVVVQ
jgi:hypothetical protein